MIHPSYVDLMNVVNKDVEEGETPIVNSRYSVVMATAKRARQIVDGDAPMVDEPVGRKPLSIAVDELWQEQLKILPQDEEEIRRRELEEMEAKIHESEYMRAGAMMSDGEEDDAQAAGEETVTDSDDE